jgi:hypothetical protein
MRTTRSQSCRRYCCCLAVPFITVVGGLTGLLLVAAGQPVVYETHHWAMQVTRAKLRIASEIQGPKVVVVSGSSGLFGMRAQDLQAATGRPAVNLSTHAGLGMDYNLYLARRVAGPGDVVILPLEYEMYQRDRPLNELVASTSLAIDFGYFRTLPPSERINYLRLLSLERVLAGVLARWNPVEDYGGYDVRKLNAWGDQTGMELTPQTQSRLRRDLADARRRALRFDPEAGAVRSLATFIRWCRENDVVVYAAWPSHVDAAPFQGPAFEAFQQAVREFYDEHGVAFIGDAAPVHRVGRRLTADTRYHLTEQGARVRTRRFIEALCSQTELCAPGRDDDAGEPGGDPASLAIAVGRGPRPH